MHKTTAFWKAEILRNPVSKELAPEDASIESHSDFESGDFVVGRLRRRAFGGQTESNRMDFGVFGWQTELAPPKKNSQGIQIRRNQRLRMRLSLAIAISNRTISWSDAGVRASGGKRGASCP